MKMKRILSIASVLLFIFLTSCSKINQAANPEVTGTTGKPQVSSMSAFKDSLVNEVKVQSTQSVVSLYGSYAQAWLLAGGKLSGVTEDAISERKLAIGNATVVGTVKEPNLELIISKHPDFVILSSEISGHVEIANSLKQMKIPYAFFTVETFEQYDTMMKIFCSLTGRSDLYKKNVTQVKAKIEDVQKTTQFKKPPTVLLLRSSSISVKALKSDSIAGAIIKDLGAINIAETDKSLLKDLSVEKIIDEDPDYILVVSMGNEKAAIAAMDKMMADNPAWSKLSAIKNKHYVILPKELFHYKPNEKWGESYEYLAELFSGN